MFTGEGLGASRDNFSTNLARLKNLRQRFTRVHADHDALLAQAEDSAEYDSGPTWTHGIDLHWLANDQREWLRNEHNTTLEMMFIYLVSMFDVFFGQWCAEHSLCDEDAWPTATPDNFRKVGLDFLPAVEKQVIEYRERRNALVHRGGIVDERYCNKVGDSSILGQRLKITETYLDVAADAIDFVVGAAAVAKYQGPPRHEARDLWPALIARVFVMT